MFWVLCTPCQKPCCLSQAPVHVHNVRLPDLTMYRHVRVFIRKNRTESDQRPVHSRSQSGQCWKVHWPVSYTGQCWSGPGTFGRAPKPSNFHSGNNARILQNDTKMSVSTVQNDSIERSQWKLQTKILLESKNRKDRKILTKWYSDKNTERLEVFTLYIQT